MNKHDIDSPSVDDHVNNSKDIKSVLLFLIVTSLLQLFTVGIYTYNAYRDRTEEGYQQILNRKLTILIQQYKRQDNKFKEIEYPLIAVRANLEAIEKTCKMPNSNPQDFNQNIQSIKNQLTQNKVKLVQAFGASQIVFSDQLFSLIKNYVNNVENIESANNSNLCTIVTPNLSQQFRQAVTTINQSMFQSLNVTKKNMIEVTDLLLSH